MDAPKPMSSFAGFPRQDLDAVTAGLTLPWSSGAVEGHVNRVILWNQCLSTQQVKWLSDEALCGVDPGGFVATFGDCLEVPGSDSRTWPAPGPWRCAQ